MNGGIVLNSLPRNINLNYQLILDTIRKEEDFDFAALAFYEKESRVSPIKWQYVSGNLNDRYKLIVLRKGKGLAGNVMKTGKRMVIETVDQTHINVEKHKYPIVLHESLTAMIAMPLWYEQYVYGVLLLGQRNNKPLPKAYATTSIIKKFGVFNEEG